VGTGGATPMTTCRRLRHCPRGALRRTAATPRPDRVRHRPTATDERRPEPRSIACRRQRRRGEPWITVPRLDALPEAVNLGKLKDEVIRRWGTLDLLDVLKDSDYLAEFSSEFISVASRGGAGIRSHHETRRHRTPTHRFRPGNAGHDQLETQPATAPNRDQSNCCKDQRHAAKGLTTLPPARRWL
jgi:hypothetical protein